MTHRNPSHGAGISRRQAIKTTAVAALAAPLVVPGSALGRNGAVAPSERIVMAGIGIGSQGGADIDASRFTFTGEGGSTYTLTDTADVEIARKIARATIRKFTTSPRN